MESNAYDDAVGTRHGGAAAGRASANTDHGDRAAGQAQKYVEVAQVDAEQAEEGRAGRRVSLPKPW